MGAQLFAYGLVWIVKFLVFNRIVFAVKTTGADGSAAAAVTGQPAGNGGSAFASGSVSGTGDESSPGERLVREPRY
jgi:hypothetical protein